MRKHRTKSIYAIRYSYLFTPSQAKRLLKKTVNPRALNEDAVNRIAEQMLNKSFSKHPAVVLYKDLLLNGMHMLAAIVQTEKPFSLPVQTEILFLSHRHHKRRTKS